MCVLIMTDELLIDLSEGANGAKKPFQFMFMPL